MPVEGRGLSSRQTQQAVRDREIGQPSNSEKRSEAADGVTRESEAETGYRLYALYDKIGRADILAHAYAQCRSNKGAPGVDGQDFADIEAYGVERWLVELALALRRETYRPEPIRRVFIPKANGKLRPLGISTLWDRVCMTAAMLVLEPIFEADLPPEIYAYRAGRHAQQAAVAVEELLFRGHPEVVDADLADCRVPGGYRPHGWGYRQPDVEIPKGFLLADRRRSVPWLMSPPWSSNPCQQSFCHRR